MEKPGLKHIDELVRLAVTGDGSAFTELWDTNIDGLRAFIRSTIRDVDDFFVDDICSRSFEKAFRQIASYDPSIGRFATWLRTIARNTALDVVEQENRSRARLVSIDSDRLPLTGLEDIKDEVDTPLETIIRDEDREKNEHYVEALPELYRNVARLRLVDGLQYKEIAEETGLELNTVRTRIRRAKAIIEKNKNDDDSR